MRIFISYRREDSAGWAGRIYDRIAHEFGRESCFMDVERIRAGDNWDEALRQQLKATDVALVVIGSNWFLANPSSGMRRLDDPGDWVRREIEAVIANDATVIPLLVEGARSPRADDLPRSLYELSRRETYKLDATSFQSDIDRLLPRIQSLDPWRSFKAPERAPLMDGLWEDVLQVHWPVDPDSLISLVPKGLEVDTFDNQAWVTIEAVREATGWYRKTPWLQSAFRTVGKTVARIGVQDFSKMPVVWFRTPVRAGALPGWLILSVGAPSRLGTALVKAYSPLSAVHYRKVTFTASGEERTLEMLKHRAPSIRTVYRPFGEPQVPKNGSLEAFLCHRQLMFSGAPGSRRSSRVEVQFAPWSLQQVELTEMKQSFLKSFGLEARSAPLVYSATRISAAVWSPRPTDASAQPA